MLCAFPSFLWQERNTLQVNLLFPLDELGVKNLFQYSTAKM